MVGRLFGKEQIYGFDSQYWLKIGNGEFVIDREQARSLVGQGWSEVVEIFYDIIHLITVTQKHDFPEHPEPEITLIQAQYGFFYFEYINIHPKYIVVLERMRQSLRSLSANTCEICGELGLRRKYFSWRPTLCRKHYIDSANRADQWNRHREQNPEIKI